MKINGHQLRVLTKDIVYLEENKNLFPISYDIDYHVNRLLREINGLRGRRVFIKDSFGDLDELIIDNNKFAGYSKCPEKFKRIINLILEGIL